MPRRRVVCEVEDLEPSTARRFDLEGHQIALVRIGDELYAVGDTCSHEDYSLSEGEVWVEDLEIECPRHGSTFDLCTGAPRSLPATRPIPVYEVEVEDGQVAVLLP